MKSLAAVESCEVKLNYYAMAIAILAECSVETAFEKLQSDHPDLVTAQLCEEDYQDIKHFRDQGLVWTEIAAIYNMPWQNIYKRIYNRKKKVC